MRSVELHPAARKELEKIPARDHDRILEQLSELERCDHPLQHHRVIKLSGRKTDDYRLRVGNWRVKFTFRENTAYVTEVDNRQAGY